LTKSAFCLILINFLFFSDFANDNLMASANPMISMYNSYFSGSGYDAGYGGGYGAPMMGYGGYPPYGDPYGGGYGAPGGYGASRGGREGGPGMKFKNDTMGSKLRPVDPRKFHMKPVVKLTYHEHAAVTRRDQAEVDLWIAENNVTLDGQGIPRPVIEFNEASFAG
jgi:ATP-dependent RNA helicase DDX5/DBP2